MPDLPPVFWTRQSLELIVERAGRLIKLDQATELLLKGRFARVVMEVDISQALAPGVNIEVDDDEIPSFWEQSEYKHVHLFCRRCGRVGH